MTTPNQCDGCQTGLTLKDGIHYTEKGYVHMGCTKNRYTHKSWEEEERALFQDKFGNTDRPLVLEACITDVADYWIERMIEAREASYIEGKGKYLGAKKDGMEAGRTAMLDEIEKDLLAIFPTWLDSVEEAGYEPPVDPLLAADHAMKHCKKKICATLQALRTR